jgi:DNA-binding response OmpR family regulator
MNKILIVDDDGELRSHLSGILKGAGYDTAEAASGSEAAVKASATSYDVVLLDMIMPRGNGAEALVEIKRASPRSKVIMITAFATVDNAVDAMKRGACEFLAKPFKIDELLTTVRRVLEESRIDECGGSKDLEGLLSALSNPIRTKILRLISTRKSMRLMELARELSIEDHTKVIFHLKILREAGIVKQGSDKAYVLSTEGERTVNCLKVLDRHLAQPLKPMMAGVAR